MCLLTPRLWSTPWITSSTPRGQYRLLSPRIVYYQLCNLFLISYLSFYLQTYFAPSDPKSSESLSRTADGWMRVGQIIFDPIEILGRGSEGTVVYRFVINCECSLSWFLQHQEIKAWNESMKFVLCFSGEHMTAGMLLLNVSCRSVSRSLIGKLHCWENQMSIFTSSDITALWVIELLLVLLLHFQVNPLHCIISNYINISNMCLFLCFQEKDTQFRYIALELCSNTLQEVWLSSRPDILEFFWAPLGALL